MLTKVVEFLEHIEQENEVPKIMMPLSSNELSLDPWFSKYLDGDKEHLFELLLASHHLHVVDIMNLVSAKIASQIYGASVEEQRQYFGLVNDHSKEELADLQDEIKYAIKFQS